MTKEKSNSKKASLNLITNVISIIVVGAFGIFIPRIILINYGSSTNGLVSSITQFVSYLSLFEAGIGGAALQSLYKPASNSQYDKINGILSAVNISYKKISLVYLISLILLSLIYPLFVLKELEGFNYFTVFLCVFFSGFGNVILFFAQGKFRIFIESLGKNYILNVLSIVIQILVSVTKIFLFLAGFNIVYVIISTFAFNLIQVVFILLYIKKKYPQININVKPDKASIKKNKFVFIHHITWLIFQNIDIVVLTIFCDLKIVSVYSLYKLVITMISNFIEVPFASLNFALGYKYNNDIDEYKKTISCFETYYSVLTSSILTVTLLLFTPFLSLYTRNVTDVNYLDNVLPILFVVSEILVFARKPYSSTITYAGHFQETLWQPIVEVILNITLTILGVLLIGIYGALISTIVSLTFRLICLIFYSSKKILEQSPLKSCIINCLNISMCIGIYFLCKKFNSCSNYGVFALKGLVFVITASFLYFIINSVLFKNDFLYFKNTLKRILSRPKKC